MCNYSAKQAELIKDKVVIFMFAQFMMCIMICIGFLSTNESDMTILNANIKMYNKLRHKIALFIKWLYIPLLIPYMGLYIFIFI